MKTLQRIFVGAFALSLLLVLLFSCKPDTKKEMSYTVISKGSTCGKVPGYFSIRDEETYKQMLDGVAYKYGIPVPDFSRRQVIALFDTTRSHPVYEIGVASLEDRGSFVAVEVRRDYRPKAGVFDQAYCVISMERTEKEIRFFEQPFKQEAEDENHMPAMGVSGCLNGVASANVAGEEYLWFRWLENGRIVFEHQSMELNCAPTVVETSVRQQDALLFVEERENYTSDSILAACICPKNVGYEAMVVPVGDSLQVDYRFTTFNRGLRTRFFKIPCVGSGKIHLGKTH